MTCAGAQPVVRREVPGDSCCVPLEGDEDGADIRCRSGQFSPRDGALKLESNPDVVAARNAPPDEHTIVGIRHGNPCALMALCYALLTEAQNRRPRKDRYFLCFSTPAK